MAHNLLAIYNVNLKSKSLIGVRKKMLAQVKEFSKHFSQVILLCPDGSNIVLHRYANGLCLATTNIKCKAAPGKFYDDVHEWLDANISQEHFSFSYTRYTPMETPVLANIMKLLSCSGTKNFIEIPTLSYENELNEELRENDSKLRKLLSKYVTAFATPTKVSNNDYFLNKPLFRTQNGVDFSNLPKQLPEWHNKKFHVLGIGCISFWHGYDRVIKAIPDFIDQHNEIDFCFHVIGETPYIETLKILAKQLNIENRVKFTGTLDGELLDQEFLKCQLAIASLGLHRINPNGHFEALKIREYLARGFPVAATDQDTLDFNALPGVFIVPATDEKIDLGRLWESTRNFYRNDQQIIHKNYAIENFSWKNIIENCYDQMITA